MLPGRVRPDFFFCQLRIDQPNHSWKEADEGLLVAEFESVFGKDPYALTVVKIDPGRYSFQLLCANGIRKRASYHKRMGFKASNARGR